MNKNQFFIQTNLLRLFFKLDAQQPIDGILIAEGDTFFAGNHRWPDMAFYTSDQIEAARKDEDAVPEFVIEVISTNDQSNKVEKKMKNYRAANVKVVWKIYPSLEEVHIYRGKKGVVCSGNDICSAEPVIPGFKISVKDIFK